MSRDKKEKTIASVCLCKSQDINKLVEYVDDSIVSRTIIDKPSGSVTLFAFDKGQRLSEHTSPYDAVVQITDGRAKLTIGGDDVAVSAGQIIIMPAKIPHAVTAEQRFKMLLTLIRGQAQSQERNSQGKI